jgi:hypothetical protein
MVDVNGSRPFAVLTIDFHSLHFFTGLRYFA